MTALSTLKAARELLGEGPHRWTQGWYAREGEGRPCGPYGSEPVCFCLAGVIKRYATDCDALSDAKKAVRRFMGHNGIGVWNDDPSRTYEDVLDLLDRAIAELGGAGA